MRKLIALLLIFSQASYAGLPPTTIKGQSETSPKTKFGFQVPHNQATNLGGINALIETGNTNILVNPGFEDGNVTGWASSGGLGGVSSTYAATGTLGLSWDSDAAAQTTTSDLIVIPNGFKGNNGYAYCNIKTVSGTATHTFTVDDGTTNIVTPVTINSSTARFQRTAVNFVYPSSGSIRIKITSVSASEPNIYIDDCFIGEATNVSSVAQAQLVGTVKITGCSLPWSTTSTTFASFATQTGCSYAVTGQALAPTTNIPAIRFSNLAPGEYKLEYEGAIRAGVSGTDAYFQFFDGTNTAREEPTIFTNTTNIVVPGINQSISYTSPQTNITLQIRSKVSAGGQSFIYGTTLNPGVIKVYYFPSQSQLAVSSAQTNYDWAEYTPTISAGFGTPTNVKFFHRRDGSNLFVKGTFVTGTVATSLGTISLPSGLVIDTTKSSIQNTSVQNGAVVGDWTQSGANQAGAIVTALGTSTLLVYTGGQRSGATALTPTNVSSTMATGTTTAFNFVVPISGWSENQKAPTLIGSVTSNANGALRIEYAKVSSTCSSSPCTIAEQSGSWVTSITRGGTGNYTVNYPSGTFATVPTCWCANNGTSTRNCSASQFSSTSIRLDTWVNAATLEDAVFSVYCIAPR